MRADSGVSRVAAVNGKASALTLPAYSIRRNYAETGRDWNTECYSLGNSALLATEMLDQREPEAMRTGEQVQIWHGMKLKLVGGL